MHLITWPDGGPAQRRSMETLPDSWEAKAPFWLDLDARHDDAARVVSRLLAPHALWEEGNLGASRPRLVEGEGYFYVLLHETVYDEEKEIRVKKAEFYLTRGFMLSIHGDPPQGLAMILEQTPSNMGPRNIDNLFALIAAAMVERSFPALDAIAETVDEVEDEAFPHPRAGLQSRIFALRKDLLNLRRTIGPMREVFNQLTRLEKSFFDRQAVRLLGATHEHLVQLYELIDLQRDVLSSLMEVYLTGLSNHLNEIMKTLTVLATIMMPLTLIVGVYGMNFRHMPELNWRYGYPLVWALMMAVAGGMLVFFRRRRWF